MLFGRGGEEEGDGAVKGAVGSGEGRGGGAAAVGGRRGLEGRTKFY